MRGGERPAILVVEDDAGVQAVLRVILAEAGYEVLAAGDAGVAEDLLASRQIALVLLDLMLPGVGGLSFLTSLRARGCAVPVIVVTGVDEARPAVEALRLGAVDYLTKPVDGPALLKHVGLALGTTARTPDAIASRVPLPRLIIVSDQVGLRAALTVALAREFDLVSVATMERAREDASLRPPTLVVVHAGRAAEPGEGWRSLKASVGSVPLIWLRGRGLAGVAPSPWAPADVVCRDLVTLFFRLRAASRRPESALAFGRPTCSVVEHVARHYADATVERLAERADLSERHLSRTFRKEMGITLRDFVLQVRVEVAKHLLRETDEKTDQVAMTAGLYDGRHLARVFRDQGLRSPHEYRRA